MNKKLNLWYKREHGGGRRKLYNEGETKVPLLVRATKFEAAYTNTSTDPKEQCVKCTHFDREDNIGSGRCDRVMGVIDPNGRCKHYDRKLKLVSE